MYQTISRSALVLAAAATGLFSTTGAALAASPGSGHASIVAAAPSFGGLVINPTSTTAYLTNPSKNQVAVLNLKTGKFGTPIPVGSDPRGIDITPDGKTLYVADSGGMTISKVTVATRKVSTISTPASFSSDTPLSIAVMNNGHAIYTTTFAGSGFGGHAYALDLATGKSTLAPAIGIGGQVTENTPLSRSGNHAVVGAVLGDDSPSTFYVYTAATGTSVSGTGGFAPDSALNRTGSTMLIGGSDVIDAKTGTLRGTISDSCLSAALNASGTTGYCLSANAVVKLNINRFLAGASLPLPTGVTGTGQLALSPNGKILVAETSAGASIVHI